MIRLATAHDMPDILRINEHSNPHPWAEQHFETALQNGNIQVIELQNKITAFAIWQTVCDESELHLLVTDLPFRNQSFAFLLLENFIQNHPNHRLILEVRQSNYSAISLYKKCGFNQIAVRKNYYLFPIEDAIIMEKLC